MSLSVYKNRHRGFTLLELLVVLVIIGLLAGIVGPRLFKNVSKSEITTAKAQIDSLGKALDQYRLDVGHYPASQEGLAALMQKPATEPNWNGPYLKKAVPLDPWGQPYQYKFPGEKSPDYDLSSFGPDKAAGGEKENADIGNW
ncbi:MAG: type II secretion system major pseudopilin GspG [bacterium]|nr:type II secretion system major pseudopilin GspG [bacterium]